MQSKVMTAVLLAILKSFNVCIAVYKSVCFEIGVMIDTTELCFETTQSDLNLDPKSQGSKKAKLLWQVSHKAFK